MAVSGSTFHKALKRAIQDVRQGASTAANRGKRERARVAEVMELRERAVDELARLQLPELSKEAIAGVAERARPAVRDVLRQREARIDELGTSIASMEQEQDHGQDELQSLTERLDALVVRRSELETAVAERLSADPEFERATKAAAYAEQRLERNESRIAELEREAKEKLPAYENSKLFQYLVRRGFGTHGYTKRGLIRRLDRWVAGLVDFQSSKRSYDFLRATPELVRNEIARRRDIFDAVMTEVEQRRDTAESELGLTQVLEDGDQLGSERDALTDRLAQRAAELDGLREERLALETRTDRFHAAALGKLRAHLESSDARALNRHARSTPDRDDDHLVEDLTDADERLRELQKDLGEADRATRLAEERVRALEAIVTRYRQQNFDSGSAYFDDYDPHTDLQRYLDGYLGAEELWRNLAKRQRFRRRPKPSRQLPRYDGRDVWNRPQSRQQSRQRSRKASRRGRYGTRRSGSSIGDTVIDIAGGVLREAMRHGIHRRGMRGGWSFPQLPTPRRSSKPRRSKRTGGSWNTGAKRHKSKSRRGRGGFTRVDGF